MNGLRFKELIGNLYQPFMADMGFQMHPIFVSGRYYRASFIGHQRKLTVTFEPGEDQISIMLINNGDADILSIDDPERTPRLSHLNKKYMSAVTSAERSENELYFGSFKSLDHVEDKLIKCAKDLRLVLPRHLGIRN